MNCIIVRVAKSWDTSGSTQMTINSELIGKRMAISELAACRNVELKFGRKSYSVLWESLQIELR